MRIKNVSELVEKAIIHYIVGVLKENPTELLKTNGDKLSKTNRK